MAFNGVGWRLLAHVGVCWRLLAFVGVTAVSAPFNTAHTWVQCTPIGSAVLPVIPRIDKTTHARSEALQHRFSFLMSITLGSWRRFGVGRRRFLRYHLHILLLSAWNLSHPAQQRTPRQHDAARAIGPGAERENVAARVPVSVICNQCILSKNRPRFTSFLRGLKVLHSGIVKHSSLFDVTPDRLGT